MRTWTSMQWRGRTAPALRITRLWGPHRLLGLSAAGPHLPQAVAAGGVSARVPQRARLARHRVRQDAAGGLGSSVGTLRCVRLPIRSDSPVNMSEPRRSDRKRTQTQFQGGTEAPRTGRDRLSEALARAAAIASAYEPLVGLVQLGAVGGGEGRVWVSADGSSALGARQEQARWPAPGVRDHRAPQRPLQQWLRWLLASRR